jgi:hypothetical protein
VDVPFTLVFIVDGLHVPLIPLLEFDGSDGAVLFWQIGAMAANTGITGAITVTSRVVVVAH